MQLPERLPALGVHVGKPAGRRFRVMASLLLALAVIGWIAWTRTTATSSGSFDWPHLKATWRARIARVAAGGQVPIIDMNCGYYEGAFKTDALARQLDQYGVALMTMTPELRPGEPMDAWQPRIHQLMADDPTYFIPLAAGSVHDMVQQNGNVDAFLDHLFEAIPRDGYPAIGEVFFRHYPSLVQFDAESDGGYHDVDIPIDGPAARRLFAFCQERRVPMEIHLDVEDSLVGALDRMLAAYPGAPIIWCHFGRVRRIERGLHYTPALIRRMLAAHPNLYFDTSCTAMNEVYLTHGRPSRIWDRSTGHLLPAWRDIIIEHPWRFLAAIDLGPDRMDAAHVDRYLRTTRRFLDELPPETRPIVACKAAWKLLFHETLSLP